MIPSGHVSKLKAYAEIRNAEVEHTALENKFSQMKERQQSYDSALTVVKKNWEQGSTSKDITNFLVQEPITVATITHVTPANNVSTTDLLVSKWQSSAAIVTMVTGEQSLDAASAETGTYYVTIIILYLIPCFFFHLAERNLTYFVIYKHNFCY
ncbi:hypothetical protein Ahy_B01g054708 [Arachis hypogaea]|uniref:Uncharacterized protein n=1 Tax=Arachis hypogaea TaxID=3818 RepID=A0A445AU70_ARAHY|nr:hypothetical protein Ahy_B01g054708 [Arachis hypogaea]